MASKMTPAPRKKGKEINSQSRRRFLKTVAALIASPMGRAVAPLPNIPPSSRLHLSPTQQRGNTVLYMWSGALTSTSAKVKASLANNIPIHLIVQAENRRETKAIKVDPAYKDSHFLASFDIKDLKPNTKYEYYVAAVDGSEVDGPIGHFKTAHEGFGSFKIAFGNCCDSGTQSGIFIDIAKRNPLFFIQIGDLHYENITENDSDKFRSAYGKVLKSTPQGEMYLTCPSVYIWDDHDFGGDNSDKYSKAAKAAQLAYRECVPHHALSRKYSGAIYHSFTIGRVKFIVSDCRSVKSPAFYNDDHRKSMLGSAQKAWLKSEFLKGKKQHSLIVWVNPLPWISGSDNDTWAGYSAERHEIATFIEDNQINNLVMLGGDAHVLAMDDGENNRYGAKHRKLFPICHAGPLDSIPKSRGGPYGQIADLNNGHYGTMEVIDDETGVRVLWKGYHFDKDSTPSRSASGSQIMSLDLQFPAALNLDPILDHELYLPFAPDE